MVVGFFALCNVERNGMLNVINSFHRESAKPQAYEIRPWLEKDFSKEKPGTSFLAGLKANGFPLLRRVRVNHAIAIHVIKDHRQGTVSKTANAIDFDINAKIAAGVSKFDLLSGRAQRLY